jgi:hypothetical protein
MNSQSQQRDSLIQLFPGIGDTTYSFDKEYFELFQNIEGFEYAVFYIRDNNEFVSKVNINIEGVVKDTVFVNRLSVLENVRLKIRKIESENHKKLESPQEVIIFTKNKSQYKGLFEMFSKENLYLISTEKAENRYKVVISEVDSILIPGESKVASSMGWGALTGLVIGGLLGIAGGDDKSGILRFSAEEKALGFGALFGLVGAIIGLIVGLSSSVDEEIIQFDTDFNLHQLNNIAYYNFIYNETSDKKYIEVQ